MKSSMIMKNRTDSRVCVCCFLKICIFVCMLSSSDPFKEQHSPWCSESFFSLWLTGTLTAKGCYLQLGGTGGDGGGQGDRGGKWKSWRSDRATPSSLKRSKYFTTTFLLPRSLGGYFQLFRYEELGTWARRPYSSALIFYHIVKVLLGQRSDLFPCIGKCISFQINIHIQPFIQHSREF